MASQEKKKNNEHFWCQARGKQGCCDQMTEAIGHQHPDIQGFKLQKENTLFFSTCSDITHKCSRYTKGQTIFLVLESRLVFYNC